MGGFHWSQGKGDVILYYLHIYLTGLLIHIHLHRLFKVIWHSQASVCPLFTKLVEVNNIMLCCGSVKYQRTWIRCCLRTMQCLSIRDYSIFNKTHTTHAAMALLSTSIRHKSDAKVSDRCLSGGLCFLGLLCCALLCCGRIISQWCMSLMYPYSPRPSRRHRDNRMMAQRKWSNHRWYG